VTGRAFAVIRAAAARLDAATPAHRDRAVDALRALAITGVILGHWLVTALVRGPGQARAALSDQSPLAAMPALAPVSWIFQTLAVFFLVGGYAAARGYRGGCLTWICARLIRLTRPVAVVVAFWMVAGAGLYAAGIPARTLRTVFTLVLDPLWFLGVFAILTVLTPPALALVRRAGARAALLPLCVVAAADLARFGLGGPAWAGWVNVLAGWLVPYLLGVAWAQGAFADAKVPALLLAGGTAATAALVLWAGYPASMVGVNGAPVSNLNPPTLAAVTFGVAQAGLALLARDRLARCMRKPLAWAPVAVVNLSAMTLFLWHQTAMLAVTMIALPAGRLAGLTTAPVSGWWIAERIAWLPAFAAVLAAAWLAFRRGERPWRSSRAAREHLHDHVQHQGDGDEQAGVADQLQHRLVADFLRGLVPAHALADPAAHPPGPGLRRLVDRLAQPGDRSGHVPRGARDRPLGPLAGELAQVPLAGVAEPPVRAEHRTDPGQADRLGIGIVAERMIGEQA
jgi:peptidoglycan/LPS O-acetylase OafA/YrhL